MRRRALGPQACVLAVVLLQACGGGRDPDGTAASAALPEIASLPRVAEAFRADGVLLGADALDDRFGRDGVRVTAALERPEDLPRFLAASRPVLACDDALPAIVYVSPLYRALLVTRWSARDAARLESVHVVSEPPEAAGERAADNWLDALPDAPSAAALLEARDAEASRRARDRSLCARTRERSTSPAPLIAGAERDPDLERVADSSELVGELHRALERLLADGETARLEALGFGAFVDVLGRMPDAHPAVLPVPVSALAGSRVAVVLYADLNVPGRYLFLGRAHGRLGDRPIDPTGRLELIVVPGER